MHFLLITLHNFNKVLLIFVWFDLILLKMPPEISVAFPWYLSVITEETTKGHPWNENRFPRHCLGFSGRGSPRCHLSIPQP
jgi:hypothetical protein